MRKFKEKSTGIFKVSFVTPHGIRELSTRTRDAKEAGKIIREANIAALEMAARSGRLTQDVIARITTKGRLTLTKAIAEWLAWLGVRSRSRATIHNYGSFLKSFAKGYGAGKAPATITEQDIHTWINEASDKAASREVRLCAMRSFFDFCLAKGWCAGNPPQLVEVNLSAMTHGQKEPKAVLPFAEEEIAKLLAAAAGFWWHAIGIARYSGLRLGDIASLEWSALEKPGLLIVWTDKRDRRVELEVDAALAPFLAGIQPAADKTHCFPEQMLIATDPPRRAMLSTQFARLCARAGLPGDKSFHSLRHSYISALASRGLPVEEIRKRVGHISTATTRKYIHQ